MDRAIVLGLVNVMAFVATQDCRWNAPNGKTYDLTPLQRRGGSYIGYGPSSLEYAVNFCTASVTTWCPTIATFQSIEILRNKECNGIVQSVVMPMFSFQNGKNDSEGIIARFTSTTLPSTSFTIHLQCSKQEYPSEPFYIINQNLGYFVWNLHTKYACGTSTQPAEESPFDLELFAVIAGLGIVFLSSILFCLHKFNADSKNRKYAAMDAENQDLIFGDFIKELEVVRQPLVMESSATNPLGSAFIFDGPEVFLSPQPPVADKRLGFSIESSQSSANGSNHFGQYADIIITPFSNFQPIGSGGFGHVYRVELSKGVVAVKIPKTDFKTCHEERTKILSEAEFLAKLQHTHITPFLGYGTHENGTILFLMEYADSTLADVLKFGPLQIDCLIRYAQGIVRGLLYLHTHTPPISHRDLKPENILIFDGKTKLADFGLATAREFVTKTTGFAGTPIWSPPESFAGRFPGPPGDIYSFGLLLWAMASGKIPYDGIRIEGIFMIKNSNQVPDIPSRCPSALSKVMKQCWQRNPKSRPVAAALELSFMQMNVSSIS